MRVGDSRWSEVEAKTQSRRGTTDAPISTCYVARSQRPIVTNLELLRLHVVGPQRLDVRVVPVGVAEVQHRRDREEDICAPTMSAST